MDAIVIKQYIHARGIFTKSDSEWLIVSARRKKEDDTSTKEYDCSSRKVSREKALEYIRANGLVRVVQSEDGDIYDTPDKSFQNYYKGNITISHRIGE